MIKVTKLNKYYHKGKSSQIHVIDNTSLELPSKGLITFLGHSGSGKTTLLNVIGGLDKASGEIEFDDVKFKRYNPAKLDKFRSKNIGYVFQNYNLLLDETVYDNLRIALDLIGITDLEEQKKRIEYSLKAVGMFKYRKKVASYLSGGQQQRVSIARALIKQSKVIIADEPTGNLDSRNTMEVMNILKKISKQALVLLVTHEENVANFYSDIIYEIKDGKIIGQREISDDVTLGNKDDSVIYLKDLNETKFDTDFGSVTVNSDDTEPLQINFNIIIKNGNIYLKSDKPVKLVEQANLKIINDHYKHIKREDIETFNYDTSWYNDEKVKKGVFKKLFKRLSNSFVSFRSVGKKMKFVYICLGLIGFVMAVGFSLFSNAVTFDLSNNSYSHKIETLFTTKSVSYNTIVGDALANNEITDFYCLQSRVLSFKERVTYALYSSYDCSVYMAPYLGNNANLICGEEPKDSEVLVSNDIATNIVKNSNRNSIDDVLGVQITLSGGKYVISGVTSNDNLMVYLSTHSYDEEINGYNVYYGSDLDYYSEGTYIGWQDEFRFAEYEQYEIASGRDVNMASEEFEVLVSEDSYYDIGDTISSGVSMQVVGKYKNYEFSIKNEADDSDYLANKEIVIANKPINVALNTYYPLTALFDFNDRIRLIGSESRLPGNKEVILPYYFMKYYDINSDISVNGRTYTVVGFFTGDVKMMRTYLANMDTYFLSTPLYSGGFGFKVIDRNALYQRLNGKSVELCSLFDVSYKSKVAISQSYIMTFVYIFIGTTIASAIFVYFVMRSKMISDIYNIGVYRSLGAPRSRINLKYFSDIFILTTFTGLIGYFCGVFFYEFMETITNTISRRLFNSSVLMSNYGIMTLGILALYLIMFVFGIIPIVTLQTKTPSEIISKYDI